MISSNLLMGRSGPENRSALPRKIHFCTCGLCPRGPTSIPSPRPFALPITLSMIGCEAIVAPRQVARRPIAIASGGHLLTALRVLPAGVDAALQVADQFAVLGARNADFCTFPAAMLVVPRADETQAPTALAISLLRQEPRAREINHGQKERLPLTSPPLEALACAQRRHIKVSNIDNR